MLDNGDRGERRDDDPGDDPGDDRGDEPGVNVIVPSLPLPPGLSIIFSLLCIVDGLICFRAAMATSRGDLMMSRYIVLLQFKQYFK